MSHQVAIQERFKNKDELTSAVYPGHLTDDDMGKWVYAIYSDDDGEQVRYGKLHEIHDCDGCILP